MCVCVCEGKHTSINSGKITFGQQAPVLPLVATRTQSILVSCEGRKKRKKERDKNGKRHQFSATTNCNICSCQGCVGPAASVRLCSFQSAETDWGVKQRGGREREREAVDQHLRLASSSQLSETSLQLHHACVFSTVYSQSQARPSGSIHTCSHTSGHIQYGHRDIHRNICTYSIH